MKRVAVTVEGVVQGVGFRPFVLRLARRYGLGGSVHNAGNTVRIEVEGPGGAVGSFVRALSEDRPAGADVRAVRTEALEARGTKDFHIGESAPAEGATALPIPPDTAPCAACLREIDGVGRRAGYAFTSCTACGPRYTIALGVPYDRARTTMAPFAPCAECRVEQADPADHRCHAQALACPACGPRLVLRARDGTAEAHGSEALAGAAAALRRGDILAIKGVGGHQLVVDARDEAKVAELRRRKHREEKPFAVLFGSIDDVGAACALTAEERRALALPAAPIVLCATRPGAGLAPSVSMSSPLTGAMLPASPLHHLLAHAFGGPLVCTSGNPSSEPLCTDDHEAACRLAAIADCILAHDRPIARPCDDSVVRVTVFGTTVLRRARGMVPLAIARPHPGPAVLALGGHLKSTVAIAAGREVMLSQHIGDLADARSVALLRTTIEDLLVFLRVRPEVVACDLHPDYASTRIAEELAGALGVPLVRVQHHHAHIAAVMAEHALTGPVLGLAWDGAGDGGDGSVWGGEALLCSGASSRRIAHLRTFSLPGGERAMREPRRAALAILAEIGEAARVPGLDDRERRVLSSMITHGTNAPRTSSMGRLFDAIAALVGLRMAVSYEGQAAMELEHAASGPLTAEPYPIDLHGGTPPYVIDWEPLVRAVLHDVDRGEDVREIARRFHAALAEVALRVAERANVAQVVLGGGCFQNARLLAAVKERLDARGFGVRAAVRAPPNDGGLSLGQAHVATERMLADRPGRDTTQPMGGEGPPCGGQRDVPSHSR